MKIQGLFEEYQVIELADNDNLKEISNSVKMITWRLLSNLCEVKKDSINSIKDNEIKKEVWNLCDGRYCKEDIAKKLTKDSSNLARDYLNPMIKEGLIFTKTIKGKKILISLEKIVENIFQSINWGFEIENE